MGKFFFFFFLGGLIRLKVLFWNYLYRFRSWKKNWLVFLRKIFTIFFYILYKINALKGLNLTKDFLKFFLFAQKILGILSKLWYETLVRKFFEIWIWSCFFTCLDIAYFHLCSYAFYFIRRSMIRFAVFLPSMTSCCLYTRWNLFILCRRWVFLRAIPSSGRKDPSRHLFHCWLLKPKATDPKLALEWRYSSFQAWPTLAIGRIDKFFSCNLKGIDYFLILVNVLSTFFRLFCSEI